MQSKAFALAILAISTWMIYLAVTDRVALTLDAFRFSFGKGAYVAISSDEQGQANSGADSSVNSNVPGQYADLNEQLSNTNIIN